MRARSCWTVDPVAYRHIAARILIATLLCALALLGGCKRSAEPVPTVQGTAQQAIDARVVPKTFTLLSAYPDNKSDTLAIALEFTRPLVGAQNFDGLISVTDADGAVVKGSWSPDENDNKILRFPFVKPALKYSVRIDAKLAAADGSTIGAEIVREVNTGPLDPVVGFASQGSVLPARETRGLPVVSVNVPEVDVEFFRVRDKQLPMF